MFADFIRVTDAGIARLRNKLGQAIAGRTWEQEPSVIEVKGWVRTLMRERGKIVPGSRREGHNVWTNTGREYNAMLQTLKSDSTTPYRNDRIYYLGVGTGLQTEDPSVVGLVNPVPFIANTFLAPLAHAATDFPLSPTRTTVRYLVSFAEDHLTFDLTPSLLISELGLFTNGNPENGFEVGPPPTGRLTDIITAAQQAPVAYKALLEPVEKTNALEFQVEWEIRY
jgi:hypothetical protein